MDAIIHQVEERPWAGLFPIAGRPLVLRQIEWLIAAGFRQIAVEASGAAGDALERRLSREGSLVGKLRVFRTPQVRGPRLAARRAGYCGEEKLLAIPGDVLGDGDLEPLMLGADGDVWAEMAAPLDGMRGGTLRVLSSRGGRARAQVPGWGVQLRSADDALALSSAVLSGALPRLGDGHLWPILVHAAEVSPGVWLARGACVETGAELIGPVLIGSGATVCGGATVGPSVLLGEGAVVERRASVARTVVADDTLIGEGVRLDRALAAADGLYDLDRRRAIRLSDPLLLGTRAAIPSTIGIGSRLVALAVAFMLAPPAALAHLWSRSRGRISFRAILPGCCAAGGSTLEGLGESVLVDLLCRLLDVVRGSRPLTGAEDEFCAGCRRFAASLGEMGTCAEEQAGSRPLRNPQRLNRVRG